MSGGFCGIVEFGGAPVDPVDLGRMVRGAPYRFGPEPRHETGASYAMAAHVDGAAATGSPQGDPAAAAPSRMIVACDARLDNREEVLRAVSTTTWADGAPPSDADLILAAYRRWKEDCPFHLVGDFAFVIWDSCRSLLFGARDPIGARPLHYADGGEVFCFASDAMQVVRHRSVRRDLDTYSLLCYLNNRTPHDDVTVFEQVRALPPGHLFLANGRSVKVVRWWNPERLPRVRYGDDREYESHFRCLFERTVADRLPREDVEPVGLLLSGGLDSGSIASMLRRGMANVRSSFGIQAVNFSFERHEACDERAYTRELSAHLGLSIEPLGAPRQGLLEGVQEFGPPLERPFAAWVNLERSAFRLLRGKGVRTVLTGLGGDNVMTGSALVFADRLARGDLGFLPELRRHARRRSVSTLRLLNLYALQPLLPGAIREGWARLRGHDRSTVVAPWVTPDAVRSADYASRVQTPMRPRLFESRARQCVYEMATTCAGAAIGYLDSMAMPLGLRTAHPFWDRRLVEFVLSIPSNQLYQAGWYKHLLRRSMRDLLPDSIRLRLDKANFVPYLDDCLRGADSQRLTALFENPLLEAIGLARGHDIRRSLSEYLAGAETSRRGSFWYAATLELWLRRHREFLGL